MKPLASVIIPTFNRRVILEKSLKSLFRQTCPPARYEIIVIDDGSTDQTRQMVEALQPPCRLEYRHQEHAGPASARNAGVSLANADLLIFIDSDIVVAPEFVEEHLEAHQAPGVIAHGPVIHTTDLDHPTDARMKIADISRAFFATGNVSIEKARLLEAGLFDEDFREYGWEDLELGYRLRRLGLKAVPCPGARGYHYKSRLEVRSLPALKQRERERGHTAVILYRKYPTTRTRMMTMITPAFFALDRLLTLGNWPDRPGVMTLLEKLERGGLHLPLRFLVRIITNHAYAEGLKEAMREGSENPPAS
ncbi:MAG: glycosyltransferase [Firmicutes bacterium]|nr:glycosyltransferase [Bacillota bacterium]